MSLPHGVPVGFTELGAGAVDLLDGGEVGDADLVGSSADQWAVERVQTDHGGVHVAGPGVLGHPEAGEGGGEGAWDGGERGEEALVEDVEDGGEEEGGWGGEEEPLLGEEGRRKC